MRGLLRFAAGLLAVITAGAGCSQEDNRLEFNGVMETVDGARVIWLWGTPEEIGYAEGALLCGEITRQVNGSLNLDIIGIGFDTIIGLIEERVIVPGDSQRQMSGMVNGIREHCPAEDLIVTSPHIEGGSREMRYEDVLLLNYGGVLQSVFFCSSLVVWADASASGDTIHARNLDSGLAQGEVPDINYLKAYRNTESGEPAFLSVIGPGKVGCVSCFDEQGTSIAGHAAYHSGPTTVPDRIMNWSMANQLALTSSVNSADRVAAAGSAMGSETIYSPGSEVMSLPCTGHDCIGGVVFEHDGWESHPDGWLTVRLPGEVDDGLETDDALVCTNQFMKRIGKEDWPSDTESIARYQTLVEGINRSLASGGVDAGLAHELLESVSDINPGTTVYSTITDLASMTLYLYEVELPDREAPYTTPHVVSLTDIFSKLCKLSD